MNQPSRFTVSGLVLACLISVAHAQAPVARWNLGEQDTGARAGSPGNAVTKDGIGAIELVANGAPVYSENTAGPDSTLSMAFDGASFYQGSAVGNDAGLDTLYQSLDFNNFSLSCDVFVTAPGAEGFSFPVSIGRNGAGLAIVEISGKWHLLHQAVGSSDPGPDVALNTWSHLDLVRKDFGSGVESRLYINGSSTPAVTLASRPNTPTDFLTIGANELDSAVPGQVEGFYHGLVDNLVLTNLSAGAPPALTELVASPGTIYTGNSIILTATGVRGDAAGLTFLWRKDGNVLTNSGAAPTVTLTNATVANSGGYDLVLTNNYGATTSSVVVVTVQDPSFSAGADVLKLQLGELDPGAAAGKPGNAETLDAVSTNNLIAYGTPVYSSEAAPGGSGLSILLDGASYYQSTNLSALYANLDFNNFSVSLDVYVNELGAGGFSFPISLGGQSGGGFSIVEIGGSWYLLHQLVAQSAVGYPVALNQWTHLELQRRQFGSTVSSRLFVNGIDVGASLTAAPALPIHPNLTLGANALADEQGVEGAFSGLIDNVVIHNYSVGTKPSFTSTLFAEPGRILLEGESLILAASGQGASPLTFNWFKDGVAIGTTAANAAGLGSITRTNLHPSDSGEYQAVLTNLFGSVTNQPVRVTVLPAGTARPTPAVQYRLGEDDAAASAGAAATPGTKPASGSLELAASGTPVYSAEVPPGGSTLSVSFDGASFFEGTGDAWTGFYTSFDFDHFSVSCDVYMTAPGASGFSFPFSIGGSGTGLAAVEVDGKWHAIHHGITLSPAGPDVVYNAWTHLELRRMNFGAGLETRLFVNGQDAGIAIAGSPAAPLNEFFIGANRVPAGPEGYFTGQVDNVRMFTYTPASSGPTLSIRLDGQQVEVLTHGTPGAKYTLWRAATVDGPWTQLASGTSDGDGLLKLTDPAALGSGAFYRTSAP